MPEWKGPVQKIDDFRWRIPQSYKSGMRTEGIVYATESMMEQIKQDESLEQVANVACLPGIVGPSMAMPDIHWGYGFPIGGVAAMRCSDGVVSPGGVGYDINCGVRLLRSDLTLKDIKGRIGDLIEQMYINVPVGVGGTGNIRVDDQELRQVMKRGAKWMVEHGIGWPEDLDVSEQGGVLDNADPDTITKEAIKRGKPQLGTLGAGNHFMEIQVVDEIYDAITASAFGITEKGQITVMVHTGSRGFGHQVCEDNLHVMQRAVQKYNIDLPDRQLACAPVTSPEGQAYLGAMACAANFAWANRQAIVHWVRESFEKVLGAGAHKLGLRQVYDVAHNMAKIEEHEVDGKMTALCVHRKGATRAFGPGNPDIPKQYREVGQPVIVPGDMGRYSFLLVGTETAMKRTWGSTCHGAGRLMSRHAAIKKMKGKDVQEELAQRGIFVRAKGRDTLSEEASYAYKDVADVVEACQGAGIARIVAKMRPLGVAKG
ncbi:MAG: RtcB family protein [Armatimonadetes bacterium]|nr:RtcB family protein [Armatimonadota bacterium]